MPYIPGTVPKDHSSQFLDFELHRVAEAYNVEEAIGALALITTNNPLGIDQAIGAEPAQPCNAWQEIAPRTDIGDGPVNTIPDPATKDIIVQVDGIYLLNFFLAFEHDLGAEVIFELFRDGEKTGLGAVIDASQQTASSSVSAVGMLSVAVGSTIDVRVYAPSPPENVTWITGALYVYKLRDLRTRFS